MKTVLSITLYILDDRRPSIFQLYLGLYSFHYTFYYSKLMAGSTSLLNLPEKSIKPSSRYVSCYIHFALNFR